MKKSKEQARAEAAARVAAIIEGRGKPLKKAAKAKKAKPVKIDGSKLKAKVVETATERLRGAVARMKISPELLAWASQKKDGLALKTFTPAQRLAVAKPAPGVLPEGQKLAMDSAITASVNWGIQQLGALAIDQGYTFLGYAYLSELAQIPEYRLISDVIATEMTRKWIKIQSVSEDKSKDERIKELEEEFTRLGVRETFKALAEQDGFFGRTHLYIDTGATDDRPELMTPLWTDDAEFNAKKFKKNSLRALKVIEPIWCYPANYNANDPLKDGWYDPDQWFVMGKQLHKTRLLTFCSKPVPDILKPAFAFGGLSMTQMAKPYVDNWLQTRQSVNDLIHAYSVMILKTDLQTLLQGGAPTELQDRCDLFDMLRDNRGVMMLNKDSEDFANVSVPLTTLDKLQAQSQEHICSVSRIPLVKYTGISPTGLNASSEGEIRVFYDTIHAAQESFFTPHLTTVFRLLQLNKWGEIDPDLTFTYEPLWEMDEVQLATKRKTDAETAVAYVNGGILAPDEVRQAIADDPTSPFNNIDPEDAPVNMEEGEQNDLFGGGGEEADNGAEAEASVSGAKAA